MDRPKHEDYEAVGPSLVMVAASVTINEPLVGPGFDVIYGLTVYDLRYYFDRKTVMTML
jgi:hypothetical protein